MSGPEAFAGAGDDHAAHQPSDADAGGPLLRRHARLVREVGLTLVTLGVVVLLFLAYQLYGTGLSEAHSQAMLKKAFDSELNSTAPASTSVAASARGTGHRAASSAPASSTKGFPSPPKSGTAIEHLVIPAIGVDRYVVQGTREADLMKGPGHYRNTVMPGQLGNAAIAGHRTTFGAPFFRLNQLLPGDKIYLTNTFGQRFVYQVSHKTVVSPSDTAVLDPTHDAQLTLTTCNPKYSAATRLVLVAYLVGRPASARPTTGARPSAPPKGTSLAGGSSGQGRAAPRGQSAKRTATSGKRTLAGSLTARERRGAWPEAVGFGVASLAAWVFTRLAIARSRRWKRVGWTLAGTAVSLVPLWFCFAAAVRIVPPGL